MTTNKSDRTLRVTRRTAIKYGASTLALAAAVRSTVVTAAANSTHDIERGPLRMNTIKTKDGTDIFYKDWGTGQPIVFHHGWPLSSDDWDAQMLFFLSKGYRVVAHDRRGHGRSSQVGTGHDMDHYASDASAVVVARLPAMSRSTGSLSDV
jgi:non-heme chloroperoxidase